MVLHLFITFSSLKTLEMILQKRTDEETYDLGYKYKISILFFLLDFENHDFHVKHVSYEKHDITDTSIIWKIINIYSCDIA